MHEWSASKEHEQSASIVGTRESWKQESGLLGWPTVVRYPSDDDRWGGVRRHVERVCECVRESVRCVLGSAGDSYYYYSSGLVLCWEPWRLPAGFGLLLLLAAGLGVSLLHLASRHGTPSQHDLLLHRCAIRRLCFFCVCLSKGSQQPKPTKPYMRAGSHLV